MSTNNELSRREKIKEMMRYTDNMYYELMAECYDDIKQLEEQLKPKVKTYTEVNEMLDDIYSNYIDSKKDFDYLSQMGVPEEMSIALLDLKQKHREQQEISPKFIESIKNKKGLVVVKFRDLANAYGVYKSNFRDQDLMGA